MNDADLIDILVVALPADRVRAEEIIDCLHEEKVAGTHRTRFFTEQPEGPAWSDLLNIAQSVPCIVFCWSRATSKDNAVTYRAFGAHILADHRAISVELEEGALPSQMSGSTCYPLYGWRAQLRGWRRFVFGNAALKQIAVAAARKVSGQDPPPPQAFWRMVRAQAWVAIVGAFALLSTLSTLMGFYSGHVTKLMDSAHKAEFLRFKNHPTCAAARKIEQEGGPWSDDARSALSRCHLVHTETGWQNGDLTLPVFGNTVSEANNDAQAKCDRYAHNVGAKPRSVNGSPFKLGTFIPGGAAETTCFLDVRKFEDIEAMR